MLSQGRMGPFQTFERLPRICPKAGMRPGLGLSLDYIARSGWALEMNPMRDPD
jgi:hypothetical protein